MGNDLLMNLLERMLFDWVFGAVALVTSIVIFLSALFLPLFTLTILMYVCSVVGGLGALCLLTNRQKISYFISEKFKKKEYCETTGNKDPEGENLNG